MFIIITAFINCFANIITAIAITPVTIKDHFGALNLFNAAILFGTISSFAHAKARREEARMVGFMSDIIAMEPAKATYVAMAAGRKWDATSGMEPEEKS